MGNRAKKNKYLWVTAIECQGEQQTPKHKDKLLQFARKKVLQDEDIKRLLEHKTEMKLRANCSNSRHNKLRDSGENGNMVAEKVSKNGLTNLTRATTSI